jgi:hypothetical protein
MKPIHSIKFRKTNLLHENLNSLHLNSVIILDWNTLSFHFYKNKNFLKKLWVLRKVVGIINLSKMCVTIIKFSFMLINCSQCWFYILMQLMIFIRVVWKKKSNYMHIKFVKGFIFRDNILFFFCKRFL